MNARNFKEFLAGLEMLSRSQRQRVLLLLQPPSEHSAIDVIETLAAVRSSCPHCAGTSLYRHGCAHGLQRYRCRDCGKTFNALTGTPLARLRERPRWLDYLDCLFDATSVRKAAGIVGVHRTTSFRWRHRFLTGIEDQPPKRLNGIAEADETFLLVTDGNAAYRRFAREAGISHAAVNLRAGVRTRGAVHVQNVNAYHRRFHQWLSRFNGVATRYLTHYLAWRHAIDARKLRLSEELLKAAIEPFHN
jgi:transposase-like protein